MYLNITPGSAHQFANIYSQTKAKIGDGILSTCTGIGVSLNGLAGATDLVGDLTAATGGSGSVVRLAAIFGGIEASAADLMGEPLSTASCWGAIAPVSQLVISWLSPVAEALSEVAVWVASNKKFELTPLLPPAFDTGLLKARKLVTDFAAEVATGETDWLPDASLVADKSGHQLNSILLTLCNQA